MKRTPATTTVFAACSWPKTRHFERVRDRAPGGLREVLEIRVHVVVGDEDGVALLQQPLRLRDQGRPLGGRDRMGRLGRVQAVAAVNALEADLDGLGEGHRISILP
jgi:hypothetical protein